MSADNSQTKTKTPSPKIDKTNGRSQADFKTKPVPKAKSKAKATAEPKAKTTVQAQTAPKAKPAVKAKPKAAPMVKARPAAKKSQAQDLAELVAAAAAEHKPLDPVLLDLRGMSSVADWFFIASAENPRQMMAIADKIVRRAREHGFRPLGREGHGRMDERWVLLDLGEVVVHLFNLEGRELYDLDGLWTDAPRRDLK